MQTPRYSFKSTSEILPSQQPVGDQKICKSVSSSNKRLIEIFTLTCVNSWFSPTQLGHLEVQRRFYRPTPLWEARMLVTLHIPCSLYLRLFVKPIKVTIKVKVILIKAGNIQGLRNSFTPNTDDAWPSLLGCEPASALNH